MKIHIGEEIKKRAKILRIGPTELGKLIFTSKQNIIGIYKRNNIDVELLKKISEALQYNFFELYSAKILPHNSDLKQKTKNSDLEELNKKLKEEVLLLKELVNTQKKIIQLLEKKSKQKTL